MKRTYVISKKRQYYKRRQSGRTPEDAAKRTHLCRSAAWAYEQAYLAHTKKTHADALAAQMAERIAHSKRTEDAIARAIAAKKLDEARAAEVPPVAVTPDAEYDPLAAAQAQADRPADEPVLTLADQIVGRRIVVPEVTDARDSETFTDADGKLARCRDPKHEFNPLNSLFQHWERIRNEMNNGTRDDRPQMFESGVWTEATGFVSDSDQREKDFIAAQEDKNRESGQFDWNRYFQNKKAGMR
jgi:hypothetical protein